MLPSAVLSRYNTTQTMCQLCNAARRGGDSNPAQHCSVRIQNHWDIAQRCRREMQKYLKTAPQVPNAIAPFKQSTAPDSPGPGTREDLETTLHRLEGKSPRYSPALRCPDRSP
ncbi:coiled-coil domain-containing protein 81 [Platysternon megacephalum]|uniref:Coiled-coil domain-containing protein 81 n=1 Tax=Platysternon megacephalum TaxID=55544 RepID=A0A4D9DWE5_9SAUR|nr:coiled-coil domain-containing protein 81 [Platysternon megacephalum]